jgi:hypothetical protein
MTQPKAPAALASQLLGPGDGIVDSLSSREWDQLVDIVVQRMEHRINDELSRRGLRSTPRVF